MMYPWEYVVRFFFPKHRELPADLSPLPDPEQAEVENQEHDRFIHHYDQRLRELELRAERVRLDAEIRRRGRP